MKFTFEEFGPPAHINRCTIRGCNKFIHFPSTRTCYTHRPLCEISGCGRKIRSLTSNRCGLHTFGRCIIDGCQNIARDAKTGKCISHLPNKKRKIRAKTYSRLCETKGCMRKKCSKKHGTCNVHLPKCIAKNCKNKMVNIPTELCAMHFLAYQTIIG